MQMLPNFFFNPQLRTLVFFCFFLFFLIVFREKEGDGVGGEKEICVREKL